MRTNKRVFSETANKKLRLVYLTAIVLCILVLALSVVFIMIIKDENRQESINDVQECSATTRRAVQNQLVGDFQTLEGIAFCISKMENVNYSQLRDLFIDINLSNSFLRLGYASVNGDAEVFDIDGSVYQTDVSDEQFFKSALAGEETVQMMIEDPYGTSGWIVRYTVPVTANDEVSGVLIGVHSAQQFAEIMNLTSFSGEGYASIIYSDGSLIVHTDTELISSNANTIFDLGSSDEAIEQNVLDKMSRGETGSYEYVSNDGHLMNAVFLPMGMNDWYIYCAVSDSYISDWFLTTASTMAIMIGVMMSAFIILVIVFLKILRRDQRSINLQTARYQMLQNISRDTILEYSVEQDRFTYTKHNGDSTPQRKTFDKHMKTQSYRVFVRADYCEAYVEVINKLRISPDVCTIELPLKLETKDYQWHRVVLRSIADENNKLKAKVTNFIGSAVNVDELVIARENARLEAAVDVVTNALTRRAFFKKASQLYAENPDNEFALLMLDVDNLKEANDTCGHVEGDKKLALVVSAFRQIVPPENIIGRYGGDEFVVLFKNMSQKAIQKCVADFKELLSKQQADAPLEITCSIGAIFAKPSVIRLDQLIQVADDALYRAKNSGKDCAIWLDASTLDEHRLDVDQKLTGQLQQSHNVQLRTLLDYMDAGVALIEVGDAINIIYASGAYYTMNGYDADSYELPHVIDDSFVAEDDLPNLIKALKEGANSNDTIECVFRFNKYESEWRHLRAVRVPYKEHCAPVLIAVITDITELKQNEMRMRKYEFERGQNSFCITLTGVYDEICEIDYASNSIVIQFSRYISNSSFGSLMPLDKSLKMRLSRVHDADEAKQLRTFIEDGNKTTHKPVRTMEYHFESPKEGRRSIQVTMLKIDKNKWLLCNIDTTSENIADK